GRRDLETRPPRHDSVAAREDGGGGDGQRPTRLLGWTLDLIAPLVGTPHRFQQRADVAPPSVSKPQRTAASDDLANRRGRGPSGPWVAGKPATLKAAVGLRTHGRPTVRPWRGATRQCGICSMTPLPTVASTSAANARPAARTRRVVRDGMWAEIASPARRSRV